MTDNVFAKVGRFFKELGEVVETPSGDARGHVRPYYAPDRASRELS